MKRLISILSIAAACITGGCIKNDIPYPSIQARFTVFNIEGAASATKIDLTSQTVTVYPSEQTDTRNIRIDSVAYNDDQKVTVSPAIGSTIDLSQPVQVTLSIYQDYQWTIRSEQSIERYFEVENQIGDADIDHINHRVVALVSAATDLANIKVTRAKLGPANVTEESPAITSLTDFTDGQQVSISYYGQTELWTIIIARSTSTVEVKSADAWARVAWISAAGEAGADNGIRYRQKGAEEWTTVPSEQITSTSGGSFTALIKGLTPQTTYEYCAYSNDNTSAVSEMTTESEMQIPNSSFDQWHQDGKVWNPWPADGEKWWDTGNRGSTIIGDSNTAPTDDACQANPSGRGVSMLTNFASVGGIGKLAAGSIYTGDFVKIDGMNGILNFGRPFSARPTKLRGYYKYTPAPINHVSEDDFDVAAFMGKNDTCNIYIILGDWDSQVEIRTRPTNRKLMDLNDPHIIAYGSLQNGNQVAEYTPFEIELEYRSTSRKPTYIICVASSSKYGDYFTGGSGSLLVVDEFSLDYDY